MPEPRGKELQMTCYCDTDLAHDHHTCRNMTGVLLYVGSTPVIAKSTRHVLRVNLHPSAILLFPAASKSVLEAADIRDFEGAVAAGGGFTISVGCCFTGSQALSAG